ncbi:MAG: hypothetical protein ACI4S2_03255 [Lachnospiraceae bacterium]
MGRRVKYFIAIIVIMCLIYAQQYFVTHAEGTMTEIEETETRSEESESEETESEETETEESEPEKEEEDIPPVEEEKKIEKYELYIPEVNGKNGYYTKKPQITICHISEVGVTKYLLKREDGKTEEGVLKEKDEKIVIEESDFDEGSNSLHVWMEDENGEKIEKFEIRKELLVDTKEPEIQMSVPKGFDTWYQQSVNVSVKGTDPVSGVLNISCKAGGKAVGSVEANQSVFVITQPAISQKGVEVTVTAEDKAGNKSEKTKTVYIDQKAPETVINGAKDYMITAKPTVITGIIEEENALKEYDMQIIRENTRGKKRKLNIPEWNTEGTRKTVYCELKKDGIYYIKINATDMSGYESVQKMQIIIDKTDPVIRYIDKLDHRYVKKFQWNYQPQQIIQDFTTYTYDVRLDGQLYHAGKSVTTEGRHKITVKAVDAAGNQAYAEAEFLIDHTVPDIIFKNIEDGEEYEEERTFEIILGKETDIIRQIQINGENQIIKSGKRAYQYTLQTCQDYEILVKASDLAGNESEKTIYFRIIPKKILIDKITEPVKKYLSAERQSEEESVNKQSARKSKTTIPLPLKVASLSVVGMVSVLMGNMMRKKRRK